MEIKGILKHIGQPITRTYNDKSYTTQKILVGIEGGTPYPQTIPFELAPKLQDQADNWKVGNEITVHYNLRGKEYTKDGVTDAYLTLQAWKVETQTVTPANQAIQEAIISQSLPMDNGENLPF